LDLKQLAKIPVVARELGTARQAAKCNKPCGVPLNHLIHQATLDSIGLACVGRLSTEVTLRAYMKVVSTNSRIEIGIVLVGELGLADTLFMPGQ
jgi:hypothetical protein